MLRTIVALLAGAACLRIRNAEAFRELAATARALNLEAQAHREHLALRGYDALPADRVVAAA